MCIRDRLKRNYGYYIEITDDEKYSDFLKTFEHSDDKKMNIDTSEERIKYILNELLSSEDYVSMDELSETVFISKNTLNKYIKIIKNIVNKYDLEYITKPSSGVKIIGSENRIRKLYVEYIPVSYTHLDVYKRQINLFVNNKAGAKSCRYS